MMDSSNLPSQADLNSLYGAWNPMSYMQGQQNQDLAAQFRDQAYKNNQNTVTEGALKNDQAVQMNPLLLAEKGLTNTGLSLGNSGKAISNASAGIDLGQKQALAPDTLDAQREELRTRLGDAQYNNLSNTILRSHLDNIKSGDPEKIAQTEPMLAFLNGSAGKNVAERTNTRGIAELNNSARLLENQATNRTNLEIAGGAQSATRYGADAQERAKELQAQLHQQLQNEALQAIKAMKLPPKEELAQIQRIMQIANPGYGTAVNLPALQDGRLRRNADGSQGDGSAANPYKLD
jgi:hypothetical protein